MHRSRHSPVVQSRWLWLSYWFISCGGASQPVAVTPAAKPKIVVQAPVAPARPSNTLYRDEVESAKRVGLGHLFELIDLEPKGDIDGQGRMNAFQGFQIVALRPASEWLSFDFAPGDILTHINGVSVEHYSAWFEQFEALSSTDQIRIDLIRDGTLKTVVVRILDRVKNSEQAAIPQPAPAVTQPRPTPAVPEKR